MNRRDVLIALGLSPIAASSLVRTCMAMQDEGQGKPGDEEMVELLFVQTAHEASLADGKLALKGITPATLYFSDRPERIVGHIATEKFVDSWGKGEDCFASDPPNAVLSLLTHAEGEEIAVVLKNPKFEGDTLVYVVEILAGAQTASGGPCSLFIDTLGKPLTAGSFGGRGRLVHRLPTQRMTPHRL